MNTQITHSSRNVYADLGLDNPLGRLAKAPLAFEVTKAIGDCGLTQSQAAAILGIDQPKNSMITCGNLSSFTLDRLVRYLDALGKEVRMVVVEKALGASVQVCGCVSL